jgi:predicted RNA-binding protein
MDCDEDESISSENVSFLEGEMKKIKIAPTPGELRYV